MRMRRSRTGVIAQRGSDVATSLTKMLPAKHQGSSTLGMIVLCLVLIAAAVAAVNAPDIQRYLRIRSM